MALEKPLLEDTVEPIDEKDLLLNPLLNSTDTNVASATGGDTSNTGNTPAPAHEVARKLLRRHQADDVRQWVRAYREKGELRKELKRACKEMKIKKASVTAWLNQVDLGFELGEESHRQSSHEVGRDHRGGGSVDVAVSGGGVGVDVDGGNGGAVGGGDDDDGGRESGPVSNSFGRHSVINVATEQLENLYEDVRDMYNTPRRWPGKGKVRWIQGYGSGYALKVRMSRG